MYFLSDITSTATSVYETAPSPAPRDRRTIDSSCLATSTRLPPNIRPAWENSATASWIDTMHHRRLSGHISLAESHRPVFLPNGHKCVASRRPAVANLYEPLAQYLLRTSKAIEPHLWCTYACAMRLRGQSTPADDVTHVRIVLLLNFDVMGRRRRRPSTNVSIFGQSESAVEIILAIHVECRTAAACFPYIILLGTSYHTRERNIDIPVGTKLAIAVVRGEQQLQGGCTVVSYPLM